MNIIFDIGNVLLAFAPQHYLAQVFGSSDVAAELLEGIFRSEEWQQLDRGTISREDACSIFAERLPGRHAQIHTVMHDWVNMLEPMTANIRLLAPLEQRHRLFYLSNMPVQAAESILERFSFWKHFSGGIFSFTTGLIKPERAFYELLLGQYGLCAAECVFIDDMGRNVDAATELGMRGIVLGEGDNLAAALAAHGVL